MNIPKLYSLSSGGTYTFNLPALFVAGVFLASTICLPATAQSVRSASADLSVMYTETALQADSFVDSIGIGTHLTYTDTPYYTAWPQILDSLRTLGVRHIRDGFYDWTPPSPFYAEHRALAASGIKTTYVVPLNNTTTPLQIEQFAPMVSDLEALELPNECDADNNCGGGGSTGIANMLAFMPTISAAGQALHVPVVGPSLVLGSSYVAVSNQLPPTMINNLHVYFGGLNPGSTGWGDFDIEGNSYGSFAWWLDQANNNQASTRPSQITESGYMSHPVATVPYTLPESVEASYIPRTLLLSFSLGIKKTFLYELLDEISSPGYGMLRGDLSPKPAYSAIQSLIANLSDPGSSFTPGSLSYAVTGGGPTLNHVLLQKRDGSFWLALWLEQSSFDRVALVPISVTPMNVTLTVDGIPSAQQLLQWDPTGTMSWRNVTPSGRQVGLTITDQVSIVKILP